MFGEVRRPESEGVTLLALLQAQTKVTSDAKPSDKCRKMCLCTEQTNK